MVGTLSSETAKAVIEQLELPGVTGKPSRTLGTVGKRRNRPELPFYSDFADEREEHGILDRKTENTEKRGERSRGIGRRRALAGGPIGVSVRDRRDTRPDGRSKPLLVWTRVLLVLMRLVLIPTRMDRLGYREMVPESDGLIVRIVPDGRRVLT
ncbi:hypothetical protein DY000_02016466 [Brassica cretica]|uniref:Uncharacterized protein n=1 Tax=Brassica cretica TaxID=69181 RepID=A0ABQ7CVZ9_BRACR|nr:hypothetical protein DY000_02016466 [Brassica cretica]